jgi:outer membrane protein assembly factor BamA
MRAIFALAAILLFGPAGPAVAGAHTPQAAGIELAGVPALSFDADEGFGYGAIVEVYDYGTGLVSPYVWTMQPTAVFSARGRRDFTLFVDAPGLLPDGWRLDAFAGLEKHIASPYYGLGNGTTYDETLDADDGPDPFYYRFGRTRASATFNLQRELAGPRLRALFGAGLVRTTVDPFPEDEGGTLYADDLGTAPGREWSNYVRAGLIWDSRDRESAPRRGVWTEVLVQRVDEQFGADASYTRWTVTDRRYYALTPTLVLAHRWLLQAVGEGAFVPDLYRVQTSFKQQEGLGGAKTIRGVLKNRYAGRGMFVWNTELRWRAVDFALAGRAFHVVVSGFLDQGRVWAGGPRIGELLSDLHRGYGGGVRIGMGENFVVAFDAGTSAEGGLPIYIGLGYLY